MVEVEIEREKENKLLNRREISLSVNHEGEETPARDKLTDEIASLVNATKAEIIIEKVEPEYGKGRSNVEVRVYDDKESAKKYERKYFQERN